MRRFLLFGLALLLLSPVSTYAVTRSSPQYYSSGGVTLQLTEPAGSIYRSGEQVRFTFTTDIDAYIIIFDIDTDGYVHLISPANGVLGQKAAAGKKYVLPDYGESSLIVAGPTGMELVFALAIPDRNRINDEELGFLLENERLPLEKKFRIDGDPLLAANTIAGELVRDISQLDGISIAYTYFYINDAVAYPRYLCGECHEAKGDPYERPCDVYEFTGDFSNREKLTYPLRRGFTVAELGSEDDPQDRVVQGDASGQQPETNIYVSFYPYDSYVYTPRTLYSFYAYDPWYWTPLWADPWWYWDPYYPGYSRYSFYFAWGWNWGSWGWSYWNPYHYTNWWYPRHHHHFRYHHYDRFYEYAFRDYRPHKYRYKTDLYRATERTASRDRDLLIGSVRSKDRSGTEVSRYYKARSRSDRPASRVTAVKDRTKTRTIYSERLKDRSRNYIKRDKPHIYNDRDSKARVSRPSIYTKKPATTRDSNRRVIRSKPRTIERSKTPATSQSRDRRTYNPQKHRSSSPPAKVNDSSRSGSSKPRSTTRSYQRSGSSSSSSKANRSGSSGGSHRSSSRSKSGGKSRK